VVNLASPLTEPLIEAVVRQMTINPRGIHGLRHWARDPRTIAWASTHSLANSVPDNPLGRFLIH
jgi:hypothetical protein